MSRFSVERKEPVKREGAENTEITHNKVSRDLKE